MQSDNYTIKLLQKLSMFIANNICDEVILKKFDEMYYEKTDTSIKLHSSHLNFLNNMDNYNINYFDVKKYVGEDCIDNVIKELLRNENNKEMQNSTYIIIFIKINPNISIEPIRERLWRLATRDTNNTSFIVKNDDNFSILTAESLVIGIK